MKADLAIFSPVIAWCVSIVHHAIQMYVGQKDNANQWKVTVLEEFLHAVFTVSINYCQNYKRFSCTYFNYTRASLEKDNEVTFLQGWLSVMRE